MSSLRAVLLAILSIADLAAASPPRCAADKYVVPAASDSLLA